MFESHNLRTYYIRLAVWLLSTCCALLAQSAYWQQRADYVMSVHLDTQTHTLRGTQQLSYYNQSPDTLRKVYYHLYFNAFQPGSMMDVRSRTIQDPDPRVRDRILHLEDTEQGYQHIVSLTQYGKALTYKTEGTILIVFLEEALLPDQHTLLEMKFEAQVPVQIRRSGRNNTEDIAYSMSQWYPKIAEYDYQGWHAVPYVGREFHGVWGNFDVKIHIDSSYTVAATGLLQNAPAIGKGYTSTLHKSHTPDTTLQHATRALPQSTRTWHFTAEHVHDFVWAADPNYLHDTLKVENGPLLRFFYTPKVQEKWQAMKPYAAQAFSYLNKHFGQYPYPVYSIIQGGDGGMEYPMATLVTGERSLQSLVNVVVHEVAHSWYQGLLATNESRYAWMDEGFTTYATTLTMQAIFKPIQTADPFEGLQQYYRKICASGTEEPMNTLADHFLQNSSYSMASYAKGALFLHQLSYIVGQQTLVKGLRTYFDTYAYKHPTPWHFIRTIEKIADIHLGWYYEYMANSTASVDYGIYHIGKGGRAKSTRIVLERKGRMPMPIELRLSQRNGEQALYYIPLQAMYGTKKEYAQSMTRHTLSAWPWTHPYYTFEVPVKFKDILSLTIDPSARLLDVNMENQSLHLDHWQRFPKDEARATVTYEGNLLHTEVKK